jgi:hypothetical protein
MSQDGIISVSPEDLARCTQILEAIASNSLLLTPYSDDERVRLFMAAGRVIHPDKAQVRRRVKALRSQKKRELESLDRVVRAATTIRAVRRDSVFHAPVKELAQSAYVGELQRSRECYVCKTHFTQVHFFYDSMCGSCADFNYQKRFQTASLEGRVAIITGARLKIGYHAALMMLRAGARVIVTTRFPNDSAMRYAREADFHEWKDRLRIYGLDLRHSPSVEAFARMMDQTLDRLDILINNAAQTVRRPPGFYSHLMEIESKPLQALPVEAQALLTSHEELKKMLLGPDPANPEGTRWLSEWHDGKINPVLGLAASAALSQIPYRCDEALNPECFPEGKLDADLQQVDTRKVNSWRMALADVPTAEMLEVQLGRAVHSLQQAQTADAPGSYRGKAHRERLGDGRKIQSLDQDRQASPHQYGQSCAQYADADFGARLREERDFHERRRYGLGDGRGSGRNLGA